MQESTWIRNLLPQEKQPRPALIAASAVLSCITSSEPSSLKSKGLLTREMALSPQRTLMRWSLLPRVGSLLSFSATVFAYALVSLTTMTGSLTTTHCLPSRMQALRFSIAIRSKCFTIRCQMQRRTVTISLSKINSARRTDTSIPSVGLEEMLRTYTSGS